MLGRQAEEDVLRILLENPYVTDSERSVLVFIPHLKAPRQIHLPKYQPIDAAPISHRSTCATRSFDATWHAGDRIECRLQILRAS